MIASDRRKPVSGKGLFFRWIPAFAGLTKCGKPEAKLASAGAARQ
jgi:hypothetical protein